MEFGTVATYLVGPLALAAAAGLYVLIASWIYHRRRTRGRAKQAA